MRKLLPALSLVTLILTIFFFYSINAPTSANTNKTVGKIEEINLLSLNFGFARTGTSLLRTNDFGRSWQEITPALTAQQRIAAISFMDERLGAVVLSDAQNARLELARTENSGANWTKQSLDLPQEMLFEANLERVFLEFENRLEGWLALRLTSNSNFTRVALFSTADGGASWQLKQNLMHSGEFDFNEFFASVLNGKEKASARINGKDFAFLSENINQLNLEAPLTADESINALDFSNAQTGWILTDAGRCQSFKFDCEQSARLLASNDGGKNWQEITPETAKSAVKLDSTNLLPPGGSTRISINRGFDKCTAAPASQMQTWWNESPFYDANIYISGRNRGCTQPQLTAAWVNQVSAMGWGLIPTIVGYQAPCSVCTNCAKHSSDPAAAEIQGRGEADIAIADANNLGLTQGTVLYYDMERYDDLSGTGACSTPVKAFLKGWTDRLKEQGYISGVYGSPTNAQNDWVNIPAASRMDAVWFARWDNIPSVWQTAPANVPNTFWANHQRIKQYQAPHNETWGGVTFNIDGNIADGPVAGVRAPKNKPSDFDGDGKSDIAVFRPDNGGWYVLQSSNNSFRAFTFGTSEDIIMPGDYDNDGRTDFAVFRPSTGVWYQASVNPARPNATVFRARHFGASGDVPVAADYDGDGNTDLAVFRNGFWYLTNSFDPRNPNFRGEHFGATGDLPVPADYDGDGRADIAVFRPSNGGWYLLRSTQGFSAIQFGASTDKPVQGDYDGDGKTDVAVYRPSNGGWYVWQSSTNSMLGVQWGLSTDIPVPGDYDGDGKWDFAVFRPQTGVWYLLQSTNGFRAEVFGAATDRPVPAAYVP